jgi:hypothetical protein
MASEVKTNKISPATSSTVTLGDASDVFQLPASAEIDIASGATLDVNGIIDLTGATKTGFPAGGLVAFSEWQLDTTFTGGLAYWGANLSESAATGIGKLGSSMSVTTDGTGVWTFPETGYWLCSMMTYNDTASSHVIQIIGENTQNSGSNWHPRAYAAESHSAAEFSSSAEASFIFDVTSVSTCHVRWSTVVTTSSISNTGSSAGSGHYCNFKFIKLADT